MISSPSLSEGSRQSCVGGTESACGGDFCRSVGLDDLAGANYPALPRGIDTLWRDHCYLASLLWVGSTPLGRIDTIRRD